MPEAAACNPLLRTPLSIIIDDSCPVVNLTYYWMHQRKAWKKKFHPDAPADKWERDPALVDAVPPTIPSDFARKWGEWCGEEGIRGKFSFIPFPAGVARIDQGMGEFGGDEFDAWMEVGRDVLAPNFDLTPEMLTHSHVVDLETFELTDEWEQGEWVDPPVEPLTDYIATAFQLLRDAGIEVEGVTSPGAFGKKKEPQHARAVLDAAMRVNGVTRPFYFLWVKSDEDPDVPIWYAEPEKGIAITSIVGCTGDWFGGWTGFDAGSADRFITEDLAGGRLPPILAKELPCVLVSHWAGYYFGGDEVGFDVLKELKRRLDAYDPDGSKTIWMKNSEIGHYWMARELSEITPAADGVTVTTRFPTENFTLRLDGPARGVRVDGKDITEAGSRAAFRSGKYLAEGDDVYVAFDLAEGETKVELIR